MCEKLSLSTEFEAKNKKFELETKWKLAFRYYKCDCNFYHVTKDDNELELAMKSGKAYYMGEDINENMHKKYYAYKHTNGYAYLYFLDLTDNHLRILKVI